MGGATKAGGTSSARRASGTSWSHCDGTCPSPLSLPVGSLAMSESLKSPLPGVIDDLWEQRSGLSPADTAARAEVVAAVDEIDAGNARVAFVDPATDEVVVDERAKRAILLAFRVLPMAQSQVGDFRHHDRMPLKTRLDGVRVLPGAIARWGAYIAPGTVLMPSFVNIGAYVDSGTMVDTWATVGSGAQIGKNVHLGGGVGIGGVLEPPEAVPVVVEDECMIFSRCVVVNGARVREGAVLGAGAILTKTTHVIDVETGEELPRGEVPAWSVSHVSRRGVRHAVPADAAPAAGGQQARQGGAQRDPAGPRRGRLRADTRSSPVFRRVYPCFAPEHSPPVANVDMS
jgi:2,3,4,5-tetrahydropyridine-2-carboxylate N-succinyltransferase